METLSRSLSSNGSPAFVSYPLPQRPSHFLGARSVQSQDSASKEGSQWLAGPLAAALLTGAAVQVKRRQRQQRRTRAQFKIARRAGPYPLGVYDYEAAADYFGRRPWKVLRRALELVSGAVGFSAKLFLDAQTGRWEENEPKRAAELTDLLTRLGPTFIKIGQALSIRADLLSPAYLRSLVELQDKVPPFPTKEADEIIESELGQPVGELFEEITPEPIASASLGQVYRAKLREGPEVAVKVQRPGMDEVVALDLHLLRLGSGPLQSLLQMGKTGLNTDITGLVDAWGSGFVGELDYRKEALNSASFQAAIEQTPLKGAVFTPKVVEGCTARRVLTTEWVYGERLEQSNAEDVTKLCSVAMNSYLTMLLETGLLHADPHPGNLLRTPDGQLCILDWGLVTSLDKDFRVAYIEHIAHLVSEDYGPVPYDLIKIGFVPEGMEEQFTGSEVTNLLAGIYGQWRLGGGANRIDVNRVFSEIQGLSLRYGNIFRIPPYFFYIARAFAVLEGIGLSNDPEYSVLAECLPYVAQRLLTDPSPKIAGALASFVYGDQKDVPERQISPERVSFLAEGFTSYATTATEGYVQNNQVSMKEEAGRIVEQIAELLLGHPGGSSSSRAVVSTRAIESASSGRLEPALGRATPLQELVLDELAKVLGAGARQVAANIGLPGSGGALPTGPISNALGPLILGGAVGRVLGPVAAAASAAAAAAASTVLPPVRLTVLAPDEKDVQALSNAQKLAEVAEPQMRLLLDRLQALPPEEQRGVALEVLQRLWTYRGPATVLAGRLAAKLVVQGVNRLRDDLVPERQQH